MRIDLAHHQRDVVLVAEFRGVVDHHRAGLGRARRVFAADRAAGGKERDVHAREVEVGKVAHGDLFAAERDLLAGGTFAGQRHQLADREFALGQDAQQCFTDGAGCAHHGYLVTALLAHLGSLVRELESSLRGARATRQGFVSVRHITFRRHVHAALQDSVMKAGAPRWGHNPTRPADCRRPIGPSRGAYRRSRWRYAG